MSDSKSLPTVPSGFKTIEEIQNLPNEDIKNQIKISIIVFVKAADSNQRDRYENL
jgi:hypothetical protein